MQSIILRQCGIWVSDSLGVEDLPSMLRNASPRIDVDFDGGELKIFHYTLFAEELMYVCLKLVGTIGANLERESPRTGPRPLYLEKDGHKVAQVHESSKRRFPVEYHSGS